MRVTVVRGGGIAGTVLQVSVDTADLDDAAASELRALTDAAEVAAAADRPPRGRPDGVRVELAVDEARVRFDEPDAPPGAADLVRWVLDCPSGVRTAGR